MVFWVWLIVYLKFKPKFKKKIPHMGDKDSLDQCG
jgi:hypothetical protein